MAETGFTSKEIARRLGGELEGDPQARVAGIAPIASAGTGDLTFLANRKYRQYLTTTQAAVVIVDRDTECPEHLTVIRHDNPYLAFAQAVELVYPDKPHLLPGVHPMAVVEDGAEIDVSAAVGPFCHVRSGAVIGARTQLISGCFVGRECRIGSDCIIYPGVKIMDRTQIGDRVIIHASTVLGSDGFGFAQADGISHKVRQVGYVAVGDDVEIGSNVSVDRGALGPTRIGNGVKIDNLVQIAHNVEIGDNSIIVAQVGISGSTKLGRDVILAGQVGVTGHLVVGDGVRVGAQSGVNKSVPAGKTMFGSPAWEINEALRVSAALRRLPDLLKRVQALEALARQEGDE
jgi:UDP-3-O-[3-hydroxymyristoyl] glucosamine N-acyltransferase